MTRQKLLLTLAVGLALATSVVMASQFAARLNWGGGGETPTAQATTSAIATSGDSETRKQSQTAEINASVSANQGTELPAMLQAFDRILGLNEEQKEHVSYENEKAFERINNTRQRTEVDDAWKANEIDRLKKFRDKRALVVLTPEQLDKWERLVQGKEAINSLKKLNEKAPNYLSGKTKYYPESEYGEFQSAEQIQKLKTEFETTINASGFKADEIEQLLSIIYNFN
jgi:hypothetical protein